MRTYLQRLDPDAGIARFYAVAVVPTLFGWSVVREWGRIGQGGTVREESHRSETAAMEIAEAHVLRKQHGGYRLRPGGQEGVSAYAPT